MSGIVHVFVVSPDTRSERRLELHTTVAKLKANLELITGIPVDNQVISLLNSESDPHVIATLSDDSKQLGYYSLRDWQVLKVDDTNPAVSFTGQMTDVSQVEKFELTEQEYAARQDTVLAYKQRHQMGRFAPKGEEKVAQPEVPTDISVSARCEVESSEAGLSKRGTVRFIGPTKFGSGAWVGIEYDEPLGKNDGSVQGERYFTCRPKYGVFVRPDKVNVGDFPVEELDLDDEEM
ncbi:Tubulin-folding cofactor B [Hypsizygus marmoreus]|uniref:Tubulin-folding cofactor B n=1 Tax=Hypsizygus marmoreus TaxID=39966 RepID=A0A369JAY3_HYPMA|nr:Tubulin-folding cofactor B [Hypsizygus marmoreus]